MASHILVKRKDRKKDTIIRVSDIRMVKIAREGKVILSAVDNGFKVAIETTTAPDVVRAALGKSFIAIANSSGQATYLVRRSWVRKVESRADGGSKVLLNKALGESIDTNTAIEDILQVLV